MNRVFVAVALNVIFFLASAAQTQTSGGISLDQRGMNYHTDKPLRDFAQIDGSHGEGILGTISMIDGKQTAYFDNNGRVVSTTIPSHSGTPPRLSHHLPLKTLDSPTYL